MLPLLFVNILMKIKRAYFEILLFTAVMHYEVITSFILSFQLWTVQKNHRQRFQQRK